MNFRVLNENPIRDYKEACKITQGIELSNKEIVVPNDITAYWIRQIIANHSTIRCIKFRMTAKAPRSVIMQIIRATKGHPQPYVQSSRPDWTGKERSNDPYEEKLFIQDHTAESWIEMCKQRLCNRTEAMTKSFIRDCVSALIHSGDPFLEAVGWCSNPACWWLKACPELKTCGFLGEKETLSETVVHIRDRFKLEENKK